LYILYCIVLYCIVYSLRAVVVAVQYTDLVRTLTLSVYCTATRIVLKE